jgi:hypothetical protein
MRVVNFIYVTSIVLLLCANVWADDGWLHASHLSSHGRLQKIPSYLYIDLGDDSDALDRLEKSDFVIDSPETPKSLSLKCPGMYKKYLIRSFFLDTKTASVYRVSSGLVVSVGSFSEPRPPERGAIAICLSGEPKEITGSVSFLK